MSKSNWWFGGVLIVLGIMLLLNNLGLAAIDIGEVVNTYWPLLLLLWGANILVVSKKSSGNLLSGGVLLALGFVFLGRNLGFWNFNPAAFWSFFGPAILILAGISLVKGPLSGGKNNIAFLGGVDRARGNWKLESGNHLAFMGGIALDLRYATIEENEYLLSCTAVMGGIEITVPPNLTVICDGTAVLGGLDFLGEQSGGIIGSTSSRQEGEGAGGAVVKIYGRALLGGIAVKVKQ